MFQRFRKADIPAESRKDLKIHELFQRFRKEERDIPTESRREKSRYAEYDGGGEGRFLI